MPLGIVSDEEFESELNNNKKPEKGVLIFPTPIGRRDGDVEVPESLRKIIGEEKLEGTSARDLQEIFGVSPASISAYANGATSTADYNKPDKELKKHIVNVRERLTKKAQNRLSYALDGITKEKLEVAELKEAASVARDMSAIIRNLEPKEESTQNNNVQFNFFVPRMREEHEFSIIDVSQEENDGAH